MDVSERQVVRGLSTRERGAFGKNLPVDFFHQTLQDLSRANFPKVVCPVSQHVFHGLRPTNRGRQLGHQIYADLGRIVGWKGIYILINWADGLREGGFHNGFF